jgi:hypothetical protein
MMAVAPTPGTGNPLFMALRNTIFQGEERKACIPVGILFIVDNLLKVNIRNKSLGLRNYLFSGKYHSAAWRGNVT